MNEFESLIRSLRCHARPAGCGDCDFYDEEGNDFDTCSSALAKKAAEELEALSWLRWHGPEELPPVSGAEDVDAETVATYRGPVLAWCRGREWRVVRYVEEENSAGGYAFRGWLNEPDDGSSAEVLAWTELPEEPEAGK